MAKFIAKYLRWAPKTAAGVEGTSFPTYGEAMDMGPLASVVETINNNRAENFGDGELQEFADRFVSVALAVTVTEMPIDTAAAVFGTTKTASGGLSFGVDDVAPEGGLGLISGVQLPKKYGNKSVYQGVFYPCVKASRQGGSFNGDASNLSFVNSNCEFTGTAEENGKYTVMSQHFDTIAQAQAWVEKMLKGGEPALAEAKAAT